MKQLRCRVRDLDRRPPADPEQVEIVPGQIRDSHPAHVAEARDDTWGGCFLGFGNAEGGGELGVHKIQHSSASLDVPAGLRGRGSGHRAVTKCALSTMLFVSSPALTSRAARRHCSTERRSRQVHQAASAEGKSPSEISEGTVTSIIRSLDDFKDKSTSFVVLTWRTPEGRNVTGRGTISTGGIPKRGQRILAIGVSKLTTFGTTFHYTSLQISRHQHVETETSTMFDITADPTQQRPNSFSQSLAESHLIRMTVTVQEVRFRDNGFAAVAACVSVNQTMASSKPSLGPFQPSDHVVILWGDKFRLDEAVRLERGDLLWLEGDIGNSPVHGLVVVCVALDVMGRSAKSYGLTTQAEAPVTPSSSKWSQPESGPTIPSKKDGQRQTDGPADGIVSESYTPRKPFSSNALPAQGQSVRMVATVEKVRFRTKGYAAVAVKVDEDQTAARREAILGPFKHHDRVVIIRYHKYRLNESIRIQNGERLWIEGKITNHRVYGPQVVCAVLDALEHVARNNSPGKSLQASSTPKVTGGPPNGLTSTRSTHDQECSADGQTTNSDTSVHHLQHKLYSPNEELADGQFVEMVVIVEKVRFRKRGYAAVAVFVDEDQIASGRKSVFGPFEPGRQVVIVWNKQFRLDNAIRLEQGDRLWIKGKTVTHQDYGQQVVCLALDIMEPQASTIDLTLKSDTSTTIPASKSFSRRSEASISEVRDEEWTKVNTTTRTLRHEPLSSLSDDRDGLSKFLASEYFRPRGTKIGIKRAKALVQALGGSDKAHEALKDGNFSFIQETGLAFARSTHNALNLIKEFNNGASSVYRDNLIELFDIGLSVRQVKTLWNSKGASTVSLPNDPYPVELLRKNPYSAFHVCALSFQQTESWLKMSITKATDEHRMAAVVTEAVRSSTKSGSSFVMHTPSFPTRSPLFQEVSKHIQHEPNIEVLNRCLDSFETQTNPEVKVVSRDGDTVHCYSSRLYKAEKVVAGALVRIGETSEALTGSNQSSSDTSLVLNKFTLTHDQERAVMVLLKQRICILTGGPGSGKTHVLKAFAGLRGEKGLHLTAPTGRAAARMTEITSLPAQTLHRFLGADDESNEFVYNKTNQVPNVSALVIDEVSMLSTELAAAVFSALPDSASLILVGDEDQLASVGPGNVLHDVIQSDRFCTVRLNHIHRQDQHSSIVAAYMEIRAGFVPQLQRYNFETESSLKDCFLIHRSSAEECETAILDMFLRSNEILGIDQRFVQILSPQNTNDLGTNKLNRAILKRLQIVRGSGLQTVTLESGHTVQEGDRVIQVKNNYSKGVFNGDVGIVHTIEQNEAGTDVTVWVKFTGHQETVKYRHCSATELLQNEAQNHGLPSLNQKSFDSDPESSSESLGHETQNDDDRLQQYLDDDSQSSDEFLRGATANHPDSQRSFNQNNFGNDLESNGQGFAEELEDTDSACELEDMDSLSELRPAFAITVHKAQGSEFDVVIVPIMRSVHFNLSRRLLYTAVSRARKYCILVGNEASIGEAVQSLRDKPRNSGLLNMLVT